MDSPDFHTLFTSFDDKINNICAKLALLNVYNSNDKNKCLHVNNIIGHIQFILHNLERLLLEQENELSTQMKRCESLFQLVNDHCVHLNKHLPIVSKINNNLNTVDSNLNIPRKKVETAKPNVINLNIEKSSELSSKPKNTTNKVSKANDKLPTKSKRIENVKTSNMQNSIPEMDYISQEEYDTIPKYMLCRLSLNVLNDSVQAFNTTITEKYKFINSFNSQNSKDNDFKRFQTYKSQENQETKSLYFCTINDIKELSSMKNDATLRKVLICLRHCKRLKEVRGNPQKLVRYCLQ